MVDYTGTIANVLDLDKVKTFIDTDEKGFVSNYMLRDRLGLHKYKVDSALSYLLRNGLIGMVEKNKIKLYFSKTRNNPLGEKNKLIGKRDEKHFEEINALAVTSDESPKLLDIKGCGRDCNINGELKICGYEKDGFICQKCEEKKNEN